MEGVVDAQMRGVLTALGGFDRCVTEFVRVTEQKVPDHVFLRYSPELHNGGLTAAGVPVYVQLLGGNAKWMAVNAASVARLNPPGIDLNFGCPSKTVNKREGGSVLLREPERVGEIVAAVRDAVDPAIPVTAKIRLGYSDANDLEEIAERVLQAGANELCVHARTKEDGYKPPAHWHEVARVAKVAESYRASTQQTMPVIINGDIVDAGSAGEALKASGAQHIMLGRGALRMPDLAAKLKSASKAESSADEYQALQWSAILQTLIEYLSRSDNDHPSFVGNRAKQWLGFLKLTYPEAEQAFQLIKRLKCADEVISTLQRINVRDL